MTIPYVSNIVRNMRYYVIGKIDGRICLPVAGKVTEVYCDVLRLDASFAEFVDLESVRGEGSRVESARSLEAMRGLSVVSVRHATGQRPSPEQSVRIGSATSHSRLIASNSGSGEVGGLEAGKRTNTANVKVADILQDLRCVCVGVCVNVHVVARMIILASMSL